MQLYAEIRDLTAWEQAFQAVIPADVEESGTDGLLVAIFEFGCFNMHGAFERPGTARELARVLGSWAASGCRSR